MVTISFSASPSCGRERLMGAGFPYAPDARNRAVLQTFNTRSIRRAARQ
jgi:hypothetical protein